MQLKQSQEDLERAKEAAIPITLNNNMVQQSANVISTMVSFTTTTLVKTTAVVIICYNRPDYLKRTLSSILPIFPKSDEISLFISQDGRVASVTELIQQTQKENPQTSITHLRHEQHANLKSG